MDMHKYLWAKTSRGKTDAWHPLLFHMLDAGNVALALWRNYLPSSTRNRFARWLRLDEDSVGRREPPGALRTFKIENIERVELVGKRYQISPRFTPGELLADTWGIWYTEAKSVDVVLKFSPQVAQRLGETVASLKTGDSLIDGSLLWCASIADTQEMPPQIWGWGADCEVLEPAWLWAKVAAQVKELARLYMENDHDEER